MDYLLFLCSTQQKLSSYRRLAVSDLLPDLVEEFVDILQFQLLVAKRLEKLLRGHVLPGIPEFLDSLEIDIIGIRIFSVFRSHLVAEPALSYLTDGQGNSQDVVLPIVEHLIPEYGTGVDLERAAEEGDDPGLEEHVAGGVVVFQVLVQDRCILTDQLPKDLIRPQNLHRIGHVKIMEQIVFVNQVAKTDEARLRPRLMDQEHRRKVAHALNVPDIRSETVKSAQDVLQRRAQAVHLLEQGVQMRKSSRNILEDQGRLLERGERLTRTRLARRDLRRQPIVIFLVLLQQVGCPLHHNVIVESVEDLRIDSELVADHAAPHLATVAHRHVALHDLLEDLAILFVDLLAALDGREEVLDPLVQMLFGVLVLEVLQILLAIGQLFHIAGVVRLVLLQREVRHQLLRHVLHKEVVQVSHAVRYLVS